MNGKNLWFSPNFKLQISNIFHQYNSFFFFSYKDILFDQSSKIPQKTFSEKNFFYGKFSINISTRGIIRSRAQSSVSFILDQRASSKGSRKKSSQPSFLLARYYSLEFENVTKGLKKTKTKKKQSIFGMEISGMHREKWCWHRRQWRRKAPLQPLCDRSSLTVPFHPLQSWREFREIIPYFQR